MCFDLIMFYFVSFTILPMSNGEAIKKLYNINDLEYERLPIEKKVF